jgi:hypothetical protein
MRDAVIHGQNDLPDMREATAAIGYSKALSGKWLRISFRVHTPQNTAAERRVEVSMSLRWT